MIGVVELVLCVIAMISAFLSLKLRDSFHAILSLLCFTISIGLLYFVMGANYVAVFELSVYSGAMTVLMLVAVYMLKR